MISEQDQYDAAFFAPHAGRGGYAYLAAFLQEMFRPSSVIDLGCGIGVTLGHLQEAGCDVYGVDGSESAAQLVRVPVLVTDLAAPLDLGRTYDLAISTEVGEHLPPQASDQFVANIARHSGGVIFFTAAQPGQGGVGHINCQPKSYWAEKFTKHGFKRSRLLEFSAWVALYPLIWDAWWIRQNTMILLSEAGRVPCYRGARLIPKFLFTSLRWRLRSGRWWQRLSRRTDSQSLKS